VAQDRQVATPAGSLLRLYPRSWRLRYEDEVRDLLEARPPGRRDRLDLVRGALDAHLHPAEPSVVSAFASLSAGATWTAAAMVVAAQPVPPDWPGYVVEALPLALIGVGCLIVAIGGLWLRLGDDIGRLDRLAVLIAVVAHVIWVLALLGALLRLGYGAPTGAASTLAAVGEALLAVALIRHGRAVLGTLLATASVALVIPAGWGFIAFGLTWSVIGLIQWRGLRGVETSGPGVA
jgi:hypothetical protein